MLRIKLIHIYKKGGGEETMANAVHETVVCGMPSFSSQLSDRGVSVLVAPSQHVSLINVYILLDTPNNLIA